VSEIPARKLKVELFDEEGNKYTIAFEGFVTREKAVKLFDLVDLLGGVPAVYEKSYNSPNLTKFDQIKLLIEHHHQVTWFSTNDIQTLYEKELKTPLRLSTIATYLSRMVERGILVAEGPHHHKRYRLNTELVKIR